MNNSTSESVNVSGSDGSDGTGGSRHGRVVIGLVAGTMIGFGVGLWLAPHVLALRQEWTDSARELARRAGERYERAGAQVAAAVDGVASSAQDIRDGVADSVAQGAQKVERFAIAAKS
jgi:gas vesicle protein